MKGLPGNATPALLENEFKKFGPIKSGGIQVRTQKVFHLVIPCFLKCWLLANNTFFLAFQWICQGFSFGFVEFEVESAVHKAVEVFIRCYFIFRNSIVKHDLHSQFLIQNQNQNHYVLQCIDANQLVVFGSLVFVFLLAFT